MQLFSIQLNFMKFGDLLLLLISQSLLFAAYGQVDNESSRNGGFVKDIPAYKNGTFPSYYLNKSKVEKMIGIHSIEGGFDSLQIRIWYGYSRTDSGQLAIISRNQGMWDMQFYYFRYLLDKGKISSISRRVVSSTPKEGWTDFAASLFADSIIQLPDQMKIRDFPDYADGNSVIFEVATKNYYRIFSYTEPKLAESNFPQAGKVVDFLEVIRSQFDFRQLRVF
jgi:hypothetical protein